MKLSNLMDPRLVHVGVNVSTVDSAIEFALKNVVAFYNHGVKYDQALARVQERERLGGTSFPSGIAIPHARMPDFDDFIISVVIPKKPIVPADESDTNSAPVRIIFLVLFSQTSSAIYLNTLAKLIESSRTESVMNALLKADSGTHFVGIFEKAGYEVKKDLVVADVMCRDVVSIRRDATLKNLTDLMYAKSFRYIPVVDADGSIVGEIGVLDLIKAGIPDYAFRIGSLKFLSELEPMTELLLNEDKILVESIMQKPSPIDSSTSVVEAAFEMVRSKKRHFAVVDEGRLVGVISSMDILNKVLRA